MFSLSHALFRQGKFEEVLRAKSTHREELLKSLFDTELYERVSNRLEDWAREAEKAGQQTDLELARLRLQLPLLCFGFTLIPLRIRFGFGFGLAL